MTARIRQVQLRNFKSFERAVVDLEPLTVLVGPNGSGKSNFVEALVFLQECLTEGLEKALRHRATPHPYWELGARDEPLVALRVTLDLEDGAVADYAVELSSLWNDRKHITRERCWVRDRSGRGAVFEIRAGSFVQAIPGIRPQVASDRLALLVASATEEFRAVYDFLSSIRRHSISVEAIQSQARLDTGEILEPDGSNAASVLKALQEDHPETKALLVRLLGRAVEGIRDIRAEQSNGQLLLRFLKDIGLPQPAWFFEWDMSDGTIRLLGLLLAVYQPNRPSLLAIEEPEATVHPAIAELVLQVLADAAADRQVLITTHSPDILDSKELREEQIRVVVQRHGRSIVAPLGHASRQAVRERLYTFGELLRLNELDEDIEAAEKSAEGLDLFGFGPGAEQSAA